MGGEVGGAGALPLILHQKISQNFPRGESPQTPYLNFCSLFKLLLPLCYSHYSSDTVYCEGYSYMTYSVQPKV